jgi:hypothetical protein
VDAEFAEPDAVRRGCEQVPERSRDHDLAAVAGRADAHRGIHIEADVAGLAQRRAPGVEADSKPDLVSLRPGAGHRSALDRDRGLEGRGRLREDREVLVGAGVDLLAAGICDGRSKEVAGLGQDRGPAVAETLEEGGRGLDVGEQEGDQANRQAAGRPPRAELAGDEADRHDAVLLGRPQQAGAGPVARLVAFEAELVEAREGVPNVGFVVDRQPPVAARVDIGESAVGELGARLGVKCRHGWHNTCHAMQVTFIGLLTLVVGVVLCFGGHRFFRFLMVLVGLTGGFLLGATGVAALTHGRLLDGLWAWVVAIVLGLILGGLAIPFYAAGVAVLGGVVAYFVASGVMLYLGFGTGILTQAVGIVAGAVAIVLIYLFRVHRLLVITVTALSGAGAIMAGVLVLLGKLPFDVATATDPTAVFRSTPLWPLLLVVLFLAGVGAQWSIRSKPAPKSTPIATQPAAAPVSPPPSATPPPETAPTEPPPPSPK